MYSGLKFSGMVGRVVFENCLKLRDLYVFLQKAK